MRQLTFTLALLALPVIAGAQNATAPSPEPAAAPAGGSGAEIARPFTWEITHRTRYAALRNQFRPGLAGDDQVLEVRSVAHGEVTRRGVTFVGEFQDARGYLMGAQSNVSPLIVDALDVSAAHVRFGGGAGASALMPELQIGRFGLQIGSARLVAQEAYRDVARAYTGVSAEWRRAAGGSLIALAVLPVVTLPDDRASLLGNKVARDREYLDTRFYGVSYDRPVLRRLANAEGYLYLLDENDTEGSRDTRDRHLWTVGGRLFRQPASGQWDIDVEAAKQGGRARASTAASDVRDLDVSTGFAHLAAGYTFARAGDLRLGLEYDYGTGDKDPDDGTWNRFDPLFGARRVDLCPTGIYGALGRENIETIGVRTNFAPTSRIDGFAVYRWARLASARDTFAGSGVRDATGQSGRDAGQQFDFRVRTWIVPSVVRFEVGATWLGKGRFLREAPNAPREGNTAYYYTDVTFTFRSR